MRLVTDTEELKAYYSKNRVWQGIASIECTSKGRLFSAFYSGNVKEGEGNYCLLLISDDGGENWSEPIAVAEHGTDGRCYDPCLWLDPMGRLWFVWAVSAPSCVWAAVCDRPDEQSLLWHSPIALGGEVMLNKPIVYSTGEWLFPIAVWQKELRKLLCCGSCSPLPSGSYVFCSIDKGKSLAPLGCAQVPNRSFDEHMLLELRDHSLRMFVRTAYGIGVSESYDGGITWTPGHDSGIPGPCSRFCIRRLPSGHILLVNHHQFQGRNNLTAMISRDECATWEGYLLLDERQNCSYPNVAFGPEGQIYIIYDRERGSFQNSLTCAQQQAREILLAKVWEEDILNGALLHKECQLRQVVSRLDEYKGVCDLYAVSWERDCEHLLEELSSEKSGERILERIFSRFGPNCAALTPDNCAILDQCAEELLCATPCADQLCREALMRRILHLLSQIQSSQEDPSGELVSFAIKRIDACIKENITLQELASSLHISKYYLCHLFQKRMGISVMQYVLCQRMVKAKVMLTSTNLPIEQISAECGFCSASYFYTAFRRFNGISPAEFRKTAGF